MNFPKKKILIIVPTLSAGGSERFVSILFNNLDRALFDVKLVVLNSENVFYKVNNTKEVYFLKKKDVKSSLWTLVKIIHFEKPEMIFCTLTSLNILLSFIKVVYSKFRLIIRESTILSIHFKPLKNSFLYEIPIKLFYRFSDRIVCQSEYMKKDLMTSYGIKEKKIIVINNPIDLSKFPLRNNSTNGTVRLITVARLDRAKGYDRILKALAQTSINFEYYAIGDFTDSKLRPIFDKMVTNLGLSSRVHLLGVQSHPQKYLMESDIYLHGSTYDGFPNVVLEAGAVGLPVVAFDTTGIQEIVVHGQSGIVVPDNDIAAYADAIKTSSESKFDKSLIRELTASRFDVSFVMNKYQDLFNSVTVS
jgi:glycosyltransferase involved in cell wall biosynthesis